VVAVVATALVIAAPVVLGAAASATTFIGSAFAAGGAAAGVSATVAGGLATAAAATAPVAAAAASIPVLGAAGTFVANTALASVGLSTNSVAQPRVPTVGSTTPTTTQLSPYRYTQEGESFIRYESSNPAFSRITGSGGVTPGTFAAASSDGIIPLSQRNAFYHLPHPEILRPNIEYLYPPSGTPIIGPRPVMGGNGNEVLFWMGY
jgi:hypothetical protein